MVWAPMLVDLVCQRFASPHASLVHTTPKKKLGCLGKKKFNGQEVGPMLDGLDELQELPVIEK